MRQQKRRVESDQLASIVANDFGIETIAVSICQLYKEILEVQKD